MLEAIRPHLRIGPAPFISKPIPFDSFQIDLSGLYITANPASAEIGSLMSCTYEGSQFTGQMSFKAQMEGSTCFDHVIFINDVTFRSVFVGNVSFKNAIFEGVADFNHTKFDGKADYSNVSFNKDALFRRARFSLECDFKNAEFNNRAIFNSAQFSEYVDCTRTQFHGDVDFSSSKFEAKTTFNEALFNKPPWFHGTTLHQDTSFYQAKFCSFKTENDLNAYRTLKQKMGDFRATTEEGRFFSYEQRTSCNLMLQRNWFSITGNLSNLYDLISDYGENIAKPIIWLDVITIYFTGWYYIDGGITAENVLTESWLTKINPALGLALQNIFNPLGLFNKQAPLIVHNPWVALLSIIQSMLTFSVLALLLLAIRRRFHKGNGQ